MVSELKVSASLISGLLEKSAYVYVYRMPALEKIMTPSQRRLTNIRVDDHAHYRLSGNHNSQCIRGYSTIDSTRSRMRMPSRSLLVVA